MFYSNLSGFVSSPAGTQVMVTAESNHTHSHTHSLRSKATFNESFLNAADNCLSSTCLTCTCTSVFSRRSPRGPFPVGVSAELLVQTSRIPPESPVRMSPVLRKARHWMNFGFSYFCRHNNKLGQRQCRTTDQDDFSPAFWSFSASVVSLSDGLTGV